MAKNENIPNFIKLDVADTFPIERATSTGSNMQVAFGGADEDGGTTLTGTITITVKSPGGIVFETPSVPIVIDIAAPETFTVVTNKVGDISIDLSGFTGTATGILLAMNYFN